jgi:hypothetical protein
MSNFKSDIKTACLQVPSFLVEILKMYFEIKYCQVNEEGNVYIANSIDNPHNLPKELRAEYV